MKKYIVIQKTKDGIIAPFRVDMVNIPHMNDIRDIADSEKEAQSDIDGHFRYIKEKGIESTDSPEQFHIVPLKSFHFKEDIVFEFEGEKYFTTIYDHELIKTI